MLILLFCIILFYDFKNTTHPINGVQVAAPSSVFQSSPSGSLKSANQKPVKNLTNEVVSVIAALEEVPVQTGIELGAECVELRGEAAECTDSTRQPPTNNSLEKPDFYVQRPPALEIPETSYSSSEDEDFYDASENMGQSPTLPS